MFQNMKQEQYEIIKSERYIKHLCIFHER